MFTPHMVVRGTRADLRALGTTRRSIKDMETPVVDARAKNRLQGGRTGRKIDRDEYYQNSRCVVAARALGRGPERQGRKLRQARLSPSILTAAMAGFCYLPALLLSLLRSWCPHNLGDAAVLPKQRCYK